MLSCTLKNFLNDHFHPGNLCGNFFPGNGVIALTDLYQKFISFSQDFLGFRTHILLQLNLRICFLFTKLQLLLCFQILLIGLITGDQTGSLLIHMAFQKPALLDHSADIFFYKFLVLSCCLGKLLKITVGVVSQRTDIFLETSQSSETACSCSKKSTATCCACTHHSKHTCCKCTAVSNAHPDQKHHGSKPHAT